MQFTIKNRWTGETQYACELTAEVAGLSYGLQLGFAVKKAISEKVNLSGSDLSGSDLSGSDLRGSDLRDSNLRDSNLSGSDLRGSDLRDSNLRDSNLSDSNLSDSNLRGSNLSGSNLRDSNLSGSDLRDSNLSGSDLRDSNLRGSNLSGSDLSGSGIPAWVPRIPNIHQAVYAAASAPNALDMSSWHACETTHCRAGWVTHLAGPAGAVMEGVYGPAGAAALIYAASDPKLERTPDFYASNDEALADMQRLAEAEAAAQVSA